MVRACCNSQAEDTGNTASLWAAASPEKQQRIKHPVRAGGRVCPPQHQKTTAAKGSCRIAHKKHLWVLCTPPHSSPRDELTAMLQSHWRKAQRTGPQQLPAGQHQATLHPTQPPEPIEKQLYQVTGHNSAEQTAFWGPMLAQPTSPWPGQGGLQDLAGSHGEQNTARPLAT